MQTTIHLQKTTLTKIERYDYRPNVIEPCRIAGVLKQIDAFLRTRKVEHALESPGYRAGEFRALPQCKTATQYYIALDETGKQYSEMPGNDETYWWLEAISQRASKLQLLIKGTSRTHATEPMGCFEFTPRETTVGDLTLHFAQMMRTTTKRIESTIEEPSPPTIIVDTMHVVASSPSGTPIHPRAERAAWTNGYTEKEIDAVFAEHENEQVQERHKGMTSGTLWAHTRAHQEASKLADAEMPTSVREIENPLRFSIHAQVGGVEQIAQGLRPVFFDRGHQYQLSRGFGPSEGRPRVDFRKPLRMQIVKARGQIAQMILEGPAMHG
ncbi:MAG TPA: hypothetical protein VJB10_01940 [Candidatus Peribacteraceae bacterium]|nr:hypothetical protein [Candidatus Peribacteraceae bacterium]